MDLINEDIVFSIMKQIARTNDKGEASGMVISTILKENRIAYDSFKLKRILVSLHSSGKISSGSLPFCWVVNISKEELEFEKNASKESDVSIDKVKFIIRKFYIKNSEYPKPNDIEDMFWKEFGKPTLKDFTRYLRDLVGDEVLLRTEDFRYYYKGLESQENSNLKAFMSDQALFG